MSQEVLDRGVLSDEQLACFQSQGFLVINHLVDTEETEWIKQKLLRLHERNVGFEEGAQFDANTADGDVGVPRFPQILHVNIYAPELACTRYHRLGLAIAKQILGPEARFRDDISFLKPARLGSDTPWHQDEAFDNPMVMRHEITIWLAVTPANAANSCMSYIPGSHRFEVLEHQPLGGNPRIHALECIGSVDSTRAVECPLPPGGVTIHSERTLHRAGPNPSDDFRLAYALIFDTPSKPRITPRHFPWQLLLSDRARRERIWRRRGGFFIYGWRRRDRLFSNLVGKLRRNRPIR